MRRNAILAVCSIAGDLVHLLPDASDLLEEFFHRESESHCKRIAFSCLARLDWPRSCAIFEQILPLFDSLDEGLQHAIIDFISLRLSVLSPAEKASTIH